MSTVTITSIDEWMHTCMRVAYSHVVVVSVGRHPSRQGGEKYQQFPWTDISAGETLSSNFIFKLYWHTRPVTLIWSKWLTLPRTPWKTAIRIRGHRCTRHYPSHLVQLCAACTAPSTDVSRPHGLRPPISPNIYLSLKQTHNFVWCDEKKKKITSGNYIHLSIEW